MGIYDEQILGAKQQAETARKLREGFTMPKGQMVSGWYVPPDAGEGLVEALKLYAGYKGETDAQDKLASILKERETKGNELLSQMPQTRNVPEQVTQQTTQNMQGGMGTTAQLLREMGGTNQPPARAMQSQNLTPMDEPQLSDNQKQFAEMLRGNRQMPVSDKVIGQQTTGQTVTPAQTIVPTDIDRQKWLMQLYEVDPAKAQIAAKMMEMQAGREDKRDLLALSMAEKRDAQQRQIEANRQQAQLIASLRPAPQEPIVPVQQADGSIIYAPRSLAVGQKVGTTAGTGSALTEGQAKATTYVSQMQSASNVMDKLLTEGFDPTDYKNQIGIGMAGGFTNVIAPEKAQQAKQAQEQWAEAFLRAKTGAAATKDEVELNRKTFFPQLGDSKDVVKQKYQARIQAEKDVQNMAGKGAKLATPRAASSAETDPLGLR